MNKLREFPGKFLWRIYVVCLVVSVVLGFVLLYSHVLHYHYSFQEFWQFFAIFGALGCVLLILVAKGIGLFIVVDEDYYKNRNRVDGVTSD